MKTFVLVLAISMAALALPATAEAHAITCYDDDVPCIANCLVHAATGALGDDWHGCAIRPRP